MKNSCIRDEIKEFLMRYRYEDINTGEIKNYTWLLDNDNFMKASFFAYSCGKTAGLEHFIGNLLKRNSVEGLTRLADETTCFRIKKYRPEVFKEVM